MTRERDAAKTNRFFNANGDFSCQSNSKSGCYEQEQRTFFYSSERKEEVLSKLRAMSFCGTPFERLSKNSQRRILNFHLKRSLLRRMKNGYDTVILSEKNGAVWSDKKVEARVFKKHQQMEKMREALVNGVKVAIDCSMADKMSPKGIHKICRQINLSYRLLTRSEKPFHLHLTGFVKDSSIHKECMRQCSEFENYIIDTTESLHYEAFPADSIIYMTPDSPNVLESLDKACVYVVGGLVDENLEQGLTYKNAEKMKLKTARLPVDVYMDKNIPSAQSVMTINQVIGVLLSVYAGKEWSDVLSCYLPKRKGFVLKTCHNQT